MSKENRKLVVYKASAGSGKTYTLVKEYLQIVIANPPSFRKILAITFTNKAALEMKNRIIEYLRVCAYPDLQNIAESDHNKYFHLVRDITKETGFDYSTIQIRASDVLQKILHNYSDFAICTIDSFVQKVFRTFAFDLKISQNYEVELDEPKLIKQSVDLMISYAGNDSYITKTMVSFINQKIENDKGWNIENDLNEFARQLLREDAVQHIGQYRSYQPEKFFKIISDNQSKIMLIKKEMMAKAQEVMDRFNSNQLEASDFFQGNKGIYNYFASVAGGDFSKTKPNKFQLKAIEENYWTTQKCDLHIKNIITGLAPFLIQAFEFIHQRSVKYKDELVIKRNIYQLALLTIIERELEAIKEEENVVFISDSYRKIHEQIINEPVPFIYQRTGEFYSHFFIDEFQDTSILQFQNLLPLLDNSLASGFLNFIVGDGKQAIYRWRNGEARQFSSLPEIFQKPEAGHFTDIENNLKRNFIDYPAYNPEVKAVNFRSREIIIDFNNKFFGFIKENYDNPDVRKMYQGLEQIPKSGNSGGYVQISLYEEHNEQTQPEKIIQIIEEQCLKNRKLKEIAIVCRTNKESSEIANILIQQGIRVVSSDSLLLSASEQVIFIISLFRFYTDNQNKVSLGFILNYLQKLFLREKHPNDFFRYYFESEKNSSPLSALEKCCELCGITFSFKTFEQNDLFNLVEEVIRTFRICYHTEVFIIFFLEWVFFYQSKYNNGISSFLDWWDETGFKKSVSVSEETDAVKILTIHKSKGLEFPVVIYPFLGSGNKKDNNVVWLSSNISNNDLPALPVTVVKNDLSDSSYESIAEEEELKTQTDTINLCYVAFTRAEEELYILSKKFKNNDGAWNISKALMEFLKGSEDWSEDKNVYEFGHVTIDLNSEDVKKQDQLQDKYISVPWQNRISIKKHSKLLWDDESGQDAMNYGNLIHQILAAIKTIDDAENTIQSFVTDGVINSSEAKSIAGYLWKLFENPQIRRFFEKGTNIITERDILTPHGEVFRPDRIIFEVEKTIIIDFKTGRKNPENNIQLINYGRLLQEITGKPSETCLLYLSETPELIFV